MRRTFAAERAAGNVLYQRFIAINDMIHEIAEGIEVGDFEIMDKFDPKNLENNVCAFDKSLKSLPCGV